MLLGALDNDENNVPSPWPSPTEGAREKEIWSNKSIPSFLMGEGEDEGDI